VKATAGTSTRRWLDGTGPPPGYNDMLGVTLLHAGDGRCGMRWTPPEGLANYSGTVQGGFIATFLDMCSFAAGMTVVGAGEALVSVKLDVEFARPVLPGARYRGDGEVIVRSRRRVTADARVLDAEDRLLARAVHLLMPVPDGGDGR
jgi:uncharacterized protein (TIGR00369 family)